MMKLNRVLMLIVFSMIGVSSVRAGGLLNRFRRADQQNNIYVQPSYSPAPYYRGPATSSYAPYIGPTSDPSRTGSGIFYNPYFVPAPRTDVNSFWPGYPHTAPPYWYYRNSTGRSYGGDGG